MLSRFQPKHAAILAAGLLGIAAFLYGIARVPATPPPPFVRGDMPKNLPEIAFSDDTGGRHTLAEYRGRYVLLNLWATYCVPCVVELPALAGLKQAIPESKVTVLAIDVGRDTPEQAAEFLAQHKVTSLGVYMDADHALIRDLRAYALPVTLLIDPNGREIGRAIGAVAWDGERSRNYFKMLAERH